MPARQNVEFAIANEETSPTQKIVGEALQRILAGDTPPRLITIDDDALYL